jgi:hypothetical protein
VVAGRKRQDLDDHTRLARQCGQLVELVAHDRGAADHMPQDALVQDVPQYRQVFSVEDGLALEASADRAVDGRLVSCGLPALMTARA